MKKSIIYIAIIFGSFGLFSHASADYGNLSYTSSTPEQVKNVGQSFTYVSGTSTAIRVANQSSGELQLRECSPRITDAITWFHLDMVLNSICTTVADWITSTSSDEINTDPYIYQYQFINSDIATSTFYFNPSKVYALFWGNGGSAGDVMRCSLVNTITSGKIFSVGSPNSYDNIGLCASFPVLIVNGDVTVPTSHIPTSGIIDTKLFPEETCPDVGFFSSTGLSGVMCHLRNFFRGGMNLATEAVSGVVETAFRGLIQIFPINIFYHINSDFAQVVATTTPDLVLTSVHPEVFGGRTYSLITSSTAGDAEAKLGFNYRGLIDKILFLVTGLVIIAHTVAVVNHLKKEKHGQI